MAKKVEDIVTDAALNVVANTCVREVLCAGEPADFADIAVRLLAAAVMTPPTDFTVGPGTPDGRSVTIAAKTNVSVTAAGNGDHVSLDDGTNLLEVTTTPLRAVTGGDTVNIASWAHTIRAAT